MQEDFHYYATYCAAIIAGFSHKESLDICYSSQLVDCCSKTFLTKVKGPHSAATTQLSLEMMDIKKDVFGLQEITRIWASFHFLPYDLFAEPKTKSTKRYKNKFRLICNTNSNLLVDTVNLAKDKSLQAIGLSMHVLADTWAHRYFAGTPSFVINNTSNFVEMVPDKNGGFIDRPIKFKNNAFKPDDVVNGIYSGTIYQANENTIMNLGHGRAGHFPDYSFAHYRYLPAWNNYNEIIKDNPSDYYHAFAQMVQAFLFFQGKVPSFEKDTYAFDLIEQHKDTINKILNKRQINACKDWKEFGENLSGEKIEDFDLTKYEQEYIGANKNEKDETYLGKFFLASLAQKSLVTNRIFSSKNPLAGISINYNEKGLKGMKEYFQLLKNTSGGAK